MNKRNYHQARRKKEESRKARQDKKQQRRLSRTAVIVGAGETEAAGVEAVQPIDPAGTTSS